MRYTRCKKNCIKIFFLAWPMIFWKLRFACKYTTQKTYKSRYWIVRKGTSIWTAYMLGTWNFVCRFSVWSSTNLEQRFWKICFLAILWLANCKKGRPYWIFGHEMANKQNFQNPYAKFVELHITENLQTKFQVVSI